MKIVVVGAGPSGLAAAHKATELARARGETPDVVLLEASDRAGGAIGTEAIDGFLAERGADGFLTEKRAVIELAKRLGIDGRLVGTRPARDGAFVVKDGELHPIPVGFSMMAPTRVRPFLRSPIMSWRGKARALAEMALPRGEARPDESLASFVRRRFGDEVLEALAQPLVSGIYGADPERLSLRATMPRFLDEEARSRSVTLGLRRKAKAAGGATRGARYGLFASFDRGMQVLVDALVATIPDLRLGEAVTAIEPGASGVVVRTTRGEHRADRVILAANGLVLAPLLRPIDVTLSSEIARIEHGSCATVVLGYRTRVLPERLDGYGFIVPKREHRPSMAATFLSRKWPNRAPEGGELVRVFLHEPGTSEEECVRVARDELRALVGVTDEPLFSRVRQWRGAMPQYHVGHLELAARIAGLAKKHAWLRIAGNSLTGVGLPDAIAAGEAAAS
jgi:oxygen-dependent protoporphyrinogen oxidase